MKTKPIKMYCNNIQLAQLMQQSCAHFNSSVIFRRLTTLIFLLFLLLISINSSNGQFLHSGNQNQKNVEPKQQLFTQEELSASMLFSNTFCQFIFNGPEESEDDDGGVLDQLNRPTRSMPDTVPTTTELSSTLHNRHHHHYPRPIQNTANNTSAEVEDDQDKLSLNNNKKRSLPSTTVVQSGQPSASQLPPSPKTLSDSDFDAMINDDPRISTTDDNDPELDPEMFRKKKKNRKKAKLNRYNHYSYSPPSEAHPVYIGLEIIDVDRINDAENYFSLQLYLFEMWHEPRLNTTSLKQYWAENSDPIPVLEANIADCLWTPSLVFEDATEKEHLLPPTSILLAHHSKVLLRKSRYSLKVRCHMNLQIYPMDKHECHFKLRAFTDPVHKVFLKWLSDPGSPKPDLLDRQNHKTVIFNQEFTPSLFDIRVGDAIQLNHSWLNERYSLLDVTFIFERRIIHSLLTVYIPSSLIVTLSWLQFWFDVEAVPGRMSLGIMSTLTIMTQILTNYEKAGNHVTAVDIWLFVCLIMVFLALMEYALAYTISHYYDDDDDLDAYNNNYQQQNLVYYDDLGSQSTIDLQKTQPQQPQCNSIHNPSSKPPPAAPPSSPPPTQPIPSSPLNKINQVDPLKTSSLPTTFPTTTTELDTRALKDFNNPDSNKENTNKESEQMALVSKSPDPDNVTDRILMAQLKILQASQELETLLNDEYKKSVDVIQAIRKTVLDAQTNVPSYIGSGNSGQNMYIHQRRTTSGSTGYNRSLSCPPRRFPPAHPEQQQQHAQPPNRLTRFRQSLRRQMSSRSLKAGGFRSGTGGSVYDPPLPLPASTGRSKLSEVDYCSRYLFPFAFVLFATGYWIALIYYKLN